MHGRTCVVTGATDGIGLVAARELARRGARVVMLGRSPAKRDAALAEVTRAATDAPPEILLGDLSGQDEVRRLSALVLERCPRIDVLLNNAGALFARRGVSVDGIERTFALNHLAGFLMTYLLRDRLLDSAPARVINVSSIAHESGQLDFDDLQHERGYTGWRAYRASKLANILFTRALGHRLAGTGVTANALHPGFVATHFALDNPWLMRTGVRIAMRLLAISPEAGAETSVHLAVSPEVEAVSGEYFVRSRRAEPSPAARDDESAERLWQISESLTGVTWAVA